MAKQTKNIGLPYDTLVDVVKIDLKGNFVGKKTIKISDWERFVKQKGFYYRAYQVGFSSFN
jgi:hypothetical protein